MARIVIKNNSSKKYICIPVDEKDECCTLSSLQEVVSMVLSKNSGNLKAEKYLEFYDPDEEHFSKRKALGLCSFILYANFETAEDGQVRHTAILEQKKPMTQPLKNFAVKSAHVLQFQLIIQDDLKESHLEFAEKY